MIVLVGIGTWGAALVKAGKWLAPKELKDEGGVPCDTPLGDA